MSSFISMLVASSVVAATVGASATVTPSCASDAQCQPGSYCVPNSSGMIDASSTCQRICYQVAVDGDATFCVFGTSWTEKCGFGGVKCPVKGATTVNNCVPGMKSFWGSRYGSGCEAQEDATCVARPNGTMHCVWASQAPALAVVTSTNASDTGAKTNASATSDTVTSAPVTTRTSSNASRTTTHMRVTPTPPTTWTKSASTQTTAAAYAVGVLALLLFVEN
ncbi:Aste57867_13858 [Aphanomyces stellatus]|uniref:Aste57867_13858 protein n=1 Tax=Aphanomyces stellatus TaxID=120398 RepID=A0A485KZ80_9STRA|nr:hypothetical protein As57867_013807 [Aphanomyces stellatus]VFT90689.1 Aste57867_13858 [Aphanomyces stellatus]